MFIRTKYIVQHYNGGLIRTSRFCAWEDALRWARLQPRAEIHHRTGIVGQFENGVATPEFMHLDQEAA